MTDNITFNIANGNASTRKFSFKAESKELINSVITVGANNTITYSDMVKLQEIARKNGDAGVLEQCDLGAEEKLKLANMNDFGKYYDITLSPDKKMFQVKIKDAGMLCKNPNLAVIKSDFGVRSDVFVKGEEIQYGNENVIPYSAPGGDFDSVELSVGDVINIPVAEINIDGSPSGGLGRFLSWLSH